MVAMGLDQIIAHVIWMAGGVADALQTFHFGNFFDELGKAHRLAFFIGPMIGIDVLP